MVSRFRMGSGVEFLLDGHLPRFGRADKWLKITRKSGYPSEWFSAFSGDEKAWVMLHFNDECSLFGWAREWPSRPEKGHFLIEGGVWYKGLGSDYERASEALGPLLILAPDVSMVEFIQTDSLASERDSYGIGTQYASLGKSPKKRGQNKKHEP